jgi:hypothetical protein
VVSDFLNLWRCPESQGTRGMAISLRVWYEIARATSGQKGTGEQIKKMNVTAMERMERRNNALHTECIGKPTRGLWSC